MAAVTCWFVRGGGRQCLRSGRTWQGVAGRWAVLTFPHSLLRVPDSACTCSLTTFIRGIALACLLALAWCLAYDEHPVNIYQVISYHLPCVYYENITNQNNTTVQFYVCSISHQYIYFTEELVYLLRTLQGLCSGLKLVCMKTCVYSMQSVNTWHIPIELTFLRYFYYSFIYCMWGGTWYLWRSEYSLWESPCSPYAPQDWVRLADTLIAEAARRLMSGHSK